MIHSYTDTCIEPFTTMKFKMRHKICSFHSCFFVFFGVESTKPKHNSVHILCDILLYIDTMYTDALATQRARQSTVMIFHMHTYARSVITSDTIALHPIVEPYITVTSRNLPHSPYYTVRIFFIFAFHYNVRFDYTRGPVATLRLLLKDVTLKDVGKLIDTKP